MNGKVRHYELFVLGRQRVSVKVRVDANPLLRLPGICSETQFRMNVFTWPCYQLCVVICSFIKSVLHHEAKWDKKYQSIKRESTFSSCGLLIPQKINTEWIQSDIVGRLQPPPSPKYNKQAVFILCGITNLVRGAEQLEKRPTSSSQMSNFLIVSHSQLLRGNVALRQPQCDKGNVNVCVFLEMFHTQFYTHNKGSNLHEFYGLCYNFPIFLPS